MDIPNHWVAGDGSQGGPRFTSYNLVDWPHLAEVNCHYLPLVACELTKVTTDGCRESKHFLGALMCLFLGAQICL